MEYKVIELEEKLVSGIKVRTNNFSENVYEVIGGLWEKFYFETYNKIENKVNGRSLGIYTEYENDEKGDYTMMTACEISSSDKNNDMIIKKIPAGKYAVFTIRGDVRTEVGKFWEQLWKMKLDRTFICDYEEYCEGTMEDCLINIYIGIK